MMMHETLLNYSTHPFSKSLSGSLQNTITRYFPLRFDFTSPTSSNTFRCFVIPWREIERLCFIMRRDVSSYNVSSLRSDNSSNMKRRVESLRALNIASLSEFISRLYATLRLHVNRNLSYLFKIHSTIRTFRIL